MIDQFDLDSILSSPKSSRTEEEYSPKTCYNDGSNEVCINLFCNDSSIPQTQLDTLSSTNAKKKLSPSKRSKKVRATNIFKETDISKLTYRQQLLVLRYRANIDAVNPLFSLINDLEINNMEEVPLQKIPKSKKNKSVSDKSTKDGLNNLKLIMNHGCENGNFTEKKDILVVEENESQISTLNIINCIQPSNIRCIEQTKPERCPRIILSRNSVQSPILADESCPMRVPKYKSGHLASTSIHYIKLKNFKKNDIPNFEESIDVEEKMEKCCKFSELKTTIGSSIPKDIALDTIKLEHNKYVRLMKYLPISYDTDKSNVDIPVTSYVEGVGLANDNLTNFGCIKLHAKGLPKCFRCFSEVSELKEFLNFLKFKKRIKFDHALKDAYKELKTAKLQNICMCKNIHIYYGKIIKIH